MTSRGRSTAEIAGYAAAVGAGLALASGAEAGILYSGVQNREIQIDPSRQATTNNFSTSSMPALGGPLGIAARAILQASYDHPVAGLFGYYVGAAFAVASGGAKFLGAGSQGGVNLAVGALIGPAGVFAASVAGNLRWALSDTAGFHNSMIGGNFADGVTGIAGFKLASGDYGWIRLRVDELGLNQPFTTLLGGTPVGSGTGFMDKITVIDWAVEDSGASILAGQTSSPVPEPSSLALLAAGAAGLATFRRRKPRLAA